MKKRILAILMTLSMVLTLVPMTALATGADLGPLSILGGDGYWYDIDEIPTDDDQIDNLDYDLDYIFNGSTYYIRMETEMTISGDSTEGEASGYRLVIKEDLTANLTFKDLNLESSYSTITLRDGATLNLTLKEASTLTAGNYGFDIGDGATLNITDESTGSLTVYSETGMYASSSDFTMDMAGGEVSLHGTNNGIYSSNANASIAISDGTLNIYSGKESAMEFYNFTALDIDITGGDITLWGGCTFDSDWTPTMVTTSTSGYSYIYAINAEPANGATQYDFHIGGDANVEALGYTGAIVLSGTVYDTSTCAPANILVNGSATLLAYTNYLHSSNPNYGLGGSTTGFTSGRTITIEDDAKVTLAKEEISSYDEIYYTNRSFLGGGDNSDSAITLQDNAILYAAAGMGSHGYYSSTYEYRIGYDGGTINILGNASIGFKEDIDAYTQFNGNGDIGIDNDGTNWSANGYTGRIGGSYANNVGGDGGTITIDTTGQVWAQQIGGGSAKTSGSNSTGGNGGTITIENGQVFTCHIGGGSAYGDNEYTAVGGDGGNITINGGTVNATGGLWGTWDSAASIGGGSAIHNEDASLATGGNGGNITITGGVVYSDLGYYSGKDYAGAAIGGGGAGGIMNAGYAIAGTGGNGGTINISGGYIDVTISSNEPATNVPALIGGGSNGGAGEITISGGTFSGLTPYHQNSGGYGADSSNIGAAKGATDADGWVHIVGGSITLTSYTTQPIPDPWPTVDDAVLYPVMLNGLSSATGVPNGVYFYGDITLMSLTLTDTDDNNYSYGITDMSIDNSAFTIWLPGPTAEEAAAANFNGAEYYTIKVTIRTNDDNTTHTFQGNVYFNKVDTSSYGYYYHNNIQGSAGFTYLGANIESIALTSDHTGGSFTYSGEDLAPNFTVRNQDNEVLTKDADYEIEILWGGMENSYEVDEKVSSIINHGDYLVTATGLGEYEGMTSTLDFFVNPLYLDISLATPQTFTKEYDGTTDVLDGDGNIIESLALTVTESSLSNVTMTPSYVDSSIGTGIGISGRVTATGNEKGNFGFTTYTAEEGYVITGDITLMVVGESDIDTSDITVTKIYDTTTKAELSNVSGDLKLMDNEGNDICTIGYTAVSAFSDANVATENKTVTLTLASLDGVNTGNYTLDSGVTEITVPATITTADYSYTLTSVQQAQEFTQGGNIADISVAQTASGVNSETVTGTAKLYTDSACTTELTNTVAQAWTTGAQSIYVAFTPDASQTNYTDKVTTGKVIVLTIVEGDPQALTFGESTKSVTYGDESFTNAATNTSENGGAISYSSSDTNVATVNATSGAVIIVGAGSATITATAAAVDGLYRETSTSYDITVAKKDITVTVDAASATYGDAIPAFDFTVSGDLVGDDAKTVISMEYSCDAVQGSDATTYDITGSATANNYDVSVTSGTLTINPCTAYENETVTAITLPISNIVFPDIVITGVGGEAVAVEVSNYAIGSDNYGTVALLETALESQTGTVTVRYSYSSDNSNYTFTTYGEVAVTLYNEMKPTVTATTNDDSDSTLVNTGKYTVATPVETAINTYTVAIQGTSTLTSYANVAEEPITGAWVGVLISATQNNAGTAMEADTLYWSSNGTDWAQLTGEAALADNDGGDGTTNFVFWMNTSTSTSQTRYIATDETGSDMLTLTFNFTAYSAPNTGGGNSGGSSSSTTDTSTDTTVSTNDNGDTTATVGTETSTSNGTTTATVSEETLTQAITDAVEATTDGVATVEIVAESGANANTVAVEVPANALATLAESDVKTLTITSDVGTLEISSEAAESIAAQAGEDAVVSITIGQVDTANELSETQQAIVGDSPVFDLSVTVDGDYVTHFDGGLVTVSVPYELADGETGDGVVVWYLDDNGNLDILFAAYDQDTGKVTFTTTHFSYYVVAYNSLYATEHSFTDVDINAYYYLPMLWALDNGITSGYSDDTFRPTASCTRAQAVTFLWRAAGEPEATMDNPFSDVSADAYYYEAVLWAVENGITTGYADGTFRPDTTCNRGAIVTFLYRFAGEPETSGDAMSDVVEGAYYYDAVLWAVSEGITTGYADGTFRPDTTCNRGAIVTFLYRNLEA